MIEIWKDIKGYEGFYAVSNTGKIKNSRTERLLKPRVKDNDYLYVTLCKNRVYKNKYIHRLVAIEFINNKYNKPQVNHKNGVRNDNRVSNLEFCTPSENISHSYKCLNRKSSTKSKPTIAKGYHFNAVKIKCIETNEVFDSIKEAANKYNTTTGAISKVLNGKSKTSAGKHWIKIDGKKSIRLIKNLDTGEVFKTISEAAEKYNISPNNISTNLSGRGKSAGGYRWGKYKHD